MPVGAPPQGSLLPAARGGAPNTESAPTPHPFESGCHSVATAAPVTTKPAHFIHHLRFEKHTKMFLHFQYCVSNVPIEK